MRWSRVSVRVGLGLAFWVASFAVSSTAFAFCRTMTCSLGKNDVQEAEECEHEGSCVSEGKPLHWSSPCLRYAVQLDGSPKSGLDGDQVAELVEQAFSLWQTPECPEGGTPHFDAQLQGYVACDQRETVCTSASGNVNVVMFHDEGWPYDFDDLGITSPSAGIETGLVQDADIEINSQRIANPSEMFELFPVIAHEVGHFLGLAHSTATGSLMLANYMTPMTSGELLTADDIAGICAIYPPSSTPLSCAERAPAYDACKNPDPDERCALGTKSHASTGCSVARPGKSRAEGELLLVAVGLVAGWLVRRTATARRYR